MSNSATTARFVETGGRLFEFIADVFRGGRKRHRVLARLHAMRIEQTWARKRRRLKRKNQGKLVVGISLLEHLGDIVAAEPVVRWARAQFPDSYTVWVSGRRYAELPGSHPEINEVIQLGCLNEWNYLSRKPLFDVLIDLQIEGRVCPQCRTPFHRQDDKSGITIKNYLEGRNILQAFCAVAGLPSLDDTPCLHIPEPVRLRVDSMKLPLAYCVLHATANQAERNWDAEKWKKIVDELASRSIHSIEVGLKAAITHDSPYYHDLCGLGILETAEIIRRSKLFLGIESGFAHVANAMGARSILLLGQYRAFRNYMPYSGNYARGINAEIIRSESTTSAIPAERVIQAIDRVI